MWPRPENRFRAGWRGLLRANTGVIRNMRVRTHHPTGPSRCECPCRAQRGQQWLGVAPKAPDPTVLFVLDAPVSWHQLAGPGLAAATPLHQRPAHAGGWASARPEGITQCDIFSSVPSYFLTRSPRAPVKVDVLNVSRADSSKKFQPPHPFNSAADIDGHFLLRGIGELGETARRAKKRP